MRGFDVRRQGPTRWQVLSAPILWLLLVSFGSDISIAAGPTVVLNEVHYHPADGSAAGEFVELFNYGTDPVDLGSWILAGGVVFTVPDEVVLAPGEFLLVAEDANELIARYGLDPALVVGEYDGRLSNRGEELRLVNRENFIVSLIRYSDGEPWPEVCDGLGPSLERVSPLREDDDAFAWRASIPVGGTPGAPNSVAVDDRGPADGETLSLVVAGADWRFFRGVEEPPPDWADFDFDDSGWEVGPSGFGYGDGDDRTLLEDMEDNYLTVFIRTTFEVEESARVIGIDLIVDYDDGFVAYLNGVEIARRNVAATGFDETSTDNHEAGTPESFAVPEGVGLLRVGMNVLALEGHNGGLGSSDFSLLPELEATLEPQDAPPPPPIWERPPRDLLINELATGELGTGWVELYNPTAAPVDAGGRSVRLDPAERGSYSLVAGTVVVAGGTLLLRESDLGFELDDMAACLLTTVDGRFIDGLLPRAEDAAHSTGRFPDGADDAYVFREPSPGQLNRVDLEAPVVINEIMYHPPRLHPGGEYIELVNRSGDVVSLWGWALAGGIDFTFPREAVLEPGGYLVVAADPQAVERHYGVTGVLGPFDGRLDNDAETLLVEDDLGNVVDRVRYADEGSWSTVPDGAGPSVELIHPELENRYGPAWAASDGDGTPGAPNSRFRDDALPVVVGVEHAPLVPTSNDPVQVLATVSDERQIEAATLYFEVDGGGGAATPVPMVDDGIRDDGVAGNDVYGAFIPPRSHLDIVAFWIRAEATGGASVTVPAGAPGRAFLYQVEDSTLASLRPTYRIVMRAEELRTLRTRGVRSDELLDLTFVAGGRAYYNRGIRYRGSSARSCSPLSYRIQFDHDRDFHGIKRLNLNGCDIDRQWIGLDFLRRTRIPAPRAWFRQVAFNGRPESDWYLHVEAIDDVFVEHSFPGDADGNLYRCVSQANLDYRGNGFDNYRDHYRKVTNEQEDDYRDVVDLCARFDDSTTDDLDFPTLIDERVDTREWASYFAAYAILGSTENSILLNNGDDYFIYHRFSDDRWVILPWDLDSCFDDANQRLFRPTVDAIVRFLRHPFYAPVYWRYLERYLESAFEPELINTRIDHLEPLFGRAQLRALRAYAAARHDFISRQIHRELDVVVGSGGSLCGGVLFPERTSVALSGNAPASDTSRVEINGFPASYDVVTATWWGTIVTTHLATVEITALDREDGIVASLDLAVEGAVESPPQVHEQPEGAGAFGFKAVDYVAVTDPDEDGLVWGIAGGVDEALGPGRDVLKAPVGGAARQVGQSVAIYRLQFTSPGAYRAYYRMRGFDGGSNTVWGPGGFDMDPDVRVRTSQNGIFEWANEGPFTVTPEAVEAGTILEFRVGVREPYTELDALVFSIDPAATPAELDASVDFRPLRPRARIEVRPGSAVRLERGAAVVTLDGSTSHDGRCGTAGLSYLWEKISGPADGTFIGNVTSPTVQVVFSSGGTYRFRLSVTGVGSDAAEITVRVLPEGGNAFVRCDADGDGEVGISDAIFSLLGLFAAGAKAPCAAAGDCNADGSVNLTDAVFNLSFLFAGGPWPAAPYPDCDLAPAADCAVATCVD